MQVGTAKVGAADFARPLYEQSRALRKFGVAKIRAGKVDALQVGALEGVRRARRASRRSLPDIETPERSAALNRSPRASATGAVSEHAAELGVDRVAQSVAKIDAREFAP